MRDVPDKPDFRLTVERAGEHVTISVIGEVDIATADQMEGAVRQHAAATPVEVDLAGVTFMDSTGVRVIDSLLRDAERGKWSLSFRAGLQDNVEQVLKLTGMLSVLQTHTHPETSEDA